MRFPARILNLGTLRVFLGLDTLEIQGDPSQKKDMCYAKTNFHASEGLIHNEIFMKYS